MRFKSTHLLVRRLQLYSATPQSWIASFVQLILLLAKQKVMTTDNL